MAYHTFRAVLKVFGNFADIMLVFQIMLPIFKIMLLNWFLKSKIKREELNRANKDETRNKPS